VRLTSGSELSQLIQRPIRDLQSVLLGARSNSDDGKIIVDANGKSLEPQFSGGALGYVPWHFIHHRPLQLLVRRLGHRSSL